MAAAINIMGAEWARFERHLISEGLDETARFCIRAGFYGGALALYRMLMLDMDRAETEAFLRLVGQELEGFRPEPS